jgi:hypothetical protein
MRRTLLLGATAASLLLVAAIGRGQSAPGFVDANGDGICDRWAVRQDLAGPGPAGQGPAWRGRAWRDTPGQGHGFCARGGRGRGLRSGEGAGAAGLGPRPGYGPASPACDGKGPKGRSRRSM